MKLTGNLEGLTPDPIRYWVKIAKDAGAKNMFTIGVPDPMPNEKLELFAHAVYEQELKGETGYPPYVGETNLKEKIVEMESNFGAKLTSDDVDRMYVTVGASQALQFIFSIFPTGSEIIVNTPYWGTIYNMAAHAGNIGVPAELFMGGKFIEENAENVLTEKSRAVYINFPANPTGEVISEGELRRMCEWAVANRLEIISDEPYKYIIFDRDKTPYVSPVSFGEDIAKHVSLISSFSKIIKPDIRLGFIRVSPEILSSHKMVGFFFRNLSAGASRGLQAGVTRLLEDDPTLGFMKSVTRGYKEKSEYVQKKLIGWGCELPYKPAGTYMVFPTTPDKSDSEEWVKKIASEKHCGFIPGTSFGGAFDGFEKLRGHFRMGFGAGMSFEKLRGIMDELTSD